jgi:hypothetical protein
VIRVGWCRLVSAGHGRAADFLLTRPASPHLVAGGLRVPSRRPGASPTAPGQGSTVVLAGGCVESAPLTRLPCLVLAPCAVAHRPGTSAGRAGRDRARPARAARSVAGSGRPGPGEDRALPAGAPRRRRRRLDPKEVDSAAYGPRRDRRIKLGYTRPTDDPTRWTMRAGPSFPSLGRPCVVVCGSLFTCTAAVAMVVRGGCRHGSLLHDCYISARLRTT